MRNGPATSEVTGPLTIRETTWSYRTDSTGSYSMPKASATPP